MADYAGQTYTAPAWASGDPVYALTVTGQPLNSGRSDGVQVTWYRMQGWDTVGGAWVTWSVYGTPDTTAARHPTPSAVSVTGAFIIDRWQA